LVLPFDNLSGDSRQEFFADGMTEEMITQLGRLQPNRLAVVARASAMRYKGRNRSIREIHSELGVDYVLEGSVRRSGNEVRITAQLVHAVDESQVWAQSYDRQVADVLRVQTDVATAVAREVRVNLPVRVGSAGPQHTPKPAAYEAYLQGQYFLHRYMREDPAKAADHFQRAIAEDPDFAAAHLGLAWSYMALAFNGIPGGGMAPVQALPKAESAILKALELDPESAGAHAMLAEVNIRYHWDWPAAEREAQKALEMNPNLVEAHDVYSDYLSVVGRFDDALAERLRCSELDPLWPEMSMELGSTYELLGRYDDAIRAYRHAAEIEPEMAENAHWTVGEVYREKHMYREHIEEWATALRLRGQQQRAARMSSIYAQQGYQPAMRFFLETAVQRRLARKQQGMWLDPLGMADLYMRLGDHDRAISYLRQAVAERSWAVPFIKYNFSALNSDPRFRELLREIGLPS
jgi:TolB-like protein/lipopolysaccharide biosynthesis regulator YciM